MQDVTLVANELATNAWEHTRSGRHGMFSTNEWGVSGDAYGRVVWAEFK